MAIINMLLTATVLILSYTSAKIQSIPWSHNVQFRAPRGDPYSDNELAAGDVLTKVEIHDNTSNIDFQFLL